ncbi:MAG: hypothetical protein J6C28_04025 [Bacilli bacterium]|nr:hypothetical protein [Bacilli bacterium]
MPKYYYADLYEIRYKDGFRGQAIYISDIIVEKRLGHVCELLTEHEIDVLPDSAKINQFGRIDESYHNTRIAEETGYHLVVFKSSLNKEHLVTPTMIEDYVDDYECDNVRFKEIYENIRTRIPVQSQKEPTVKQKVRTYKGTKK